MSMKMLEIDSLSFGYEAPDILNNLSLSIIPGEVFCLLGPNGSGKTTLLDCMLGLNTPRNGRISIEGENISGMKPADIAKLVAYIPQSHQKNFPFTVFDVVLMGRTAFTGFFDSPDAGDRRRVSEILSKLGMNHLSNRDYTKLSGGESQLVLIMRALAQEAPLLLMDEPASHLDFRNEMILLEMIIDIIKSGRRSVILTTHSPYLAFFLENRGVPVRAGLLSNGRLRACGAPSDVLNPAHIREIFGVDAAMVNSCSGDETLKSIIPIKSISNGD